MNNIQIETYESVVQQPERSRQNFESLCNQFWNWEEFDEINQDEEPRLDWNGSNYTHRVTAALWKMYQAAPEQPAIPEQKIVGWIFEDELPKNYPYEAMFPHSKVDVVRMFPVFAPSAAQPVIPEQPELRYGENRNGMEGCVTISITELAADAAKLLSAQPVSEPYKSAANDIIAERQRQISAEGWTVEYDDEHTEGEIASAAACYALFANDQGFSTPAHWPWGKEWWKQAGQRRDLIKAGALILAEIERLDRAATAQESE